MKYEDPACAYCPPTVRACREGEAAERGPGFCPTKVDPETQALTRPLYDDPETRKISRESALVESEGYCRHLLQPRVGPQQAAEPAETSPSSLSDFALRQAAKRETARDFGSEWPSARRRPARTSDMTAAAGVSVQ